MGSGKHIHPNERCIIHPEAFWIFKKNEADRTDATGIVYPLRISSLPRSIPDLPSYGGGLERLC